MSLAVSASTSVAGVLRHLGLRPTGGAHAHISRTIKMFGIDTSHFRLYNPSSHSSRRLRPEEVLIVLQVGSPRTKPPLLTRALIESAVPYVCAARRDNFAGRSKGKHSGHAAATRSLGITS